MKHILYFLLFVTIILSCNKQVEEKIGTISYLDCENIVYDSLNQIITIPFYGGNGGKYAAQLINSTGITGLTATLKSGSFSNSKTLDDLTATLQGNDDVNGFLTFKLSGTPSSKKGIAYFDLNIGGQNCSFSIPIGSNNNNQGGGTNTQGKIGPNVTDIDGNTYKTVYIGTQQWMAENLKVSKYNDGTMIPYVTDNTQWSTTGAWSYYNNDAANNAKYGKLYNWYAVSPTTNGNKNVCPTGWHVPSDAEWTVLSDYLGGVSVAGGKMKEAGTTSWHSPNVDATNSSLFTGVPGGNRGNYGNYNGVGGNGSWWSSTEDDTYDAWGRVLYSNGGYAVRLFYNKRNGLSVRCLRD